MTEWAAETTHRIGRNIAEARKRRKLTAQAVADRCTAFGAPMKRTTLANLENGRRDSIAVTDLVAIAAALELPPVYLLFPLEQAGEIVDELPVVEQESLTAMLRFTGEIPLMDDDPVYLVGQVLRSLHREEAKACGLISELREEDDMEDRDYIWIQNQIEESTQSAFEDRERLRSLKSHVPPVPEDLRVYYRRLKTLKKMGRLG